MNASQPRPYTSPRVTLFAILSLGLQGFASLGLADATRVDVAEELERLMGTYGFTIKSAQLEATRHTSARAEGEALIPRLRTLLEQFDHVIVQRSDGSVERVIILGVKTAVTPTTQAPDPKPGQNPTSAEGEGAAPAAEIVVETQRKGTSHALMLGLEGESGKRVNRTLLLDTGADYVVLPASLLGPLGIHPGALRRQPVQTANGRIDAQLGTLNAIWFGDEKVTGVTTAFIDDSRLGGNALLGMSVLARFRVTIDDAQNRIVLTR